MEPGLTTCAQGVVMSSKRDHAFGLFVCGAVLIGVSTISIALSPTARAASPGRVVLFVSGGWLVGALLCARGWWRLREAKKHYPDQTWLQFLHTELVAVAVMIVALLGWFLVPEAWRDAVMRALHDLETAIQVTRGGHP
jgi:hypothetical protein